MCNLRNPRPSCRFSVTARRSAKIAALLLSALLLAALAGFWFAAPQAGVVFPALLLSLALASAFLAGLLWSWRTPDDNERVQIAERALLASERRLLNILDHLDALVYVSDLANDEILFVNAHGRALFGEIEGETCWRALHGRDERCANCTAEELFDAHGQPSGVRHWEVRNDRNGRRYDCRDQAMTWTNSHYARLQIAFDITERVENAERLARSEQALRAEHDLFSSGPVVTFVWGAEPNWPIRRVSSNAKDILGYDVEELCAPGFHFIDLIHPEDRARTEDEVASHLSAGNQRFEQSYRLAVREDGQVRYRWFYDVTQVVRTCDGGPDEIRGYLFDQTHIKEMEAALAREAEDRRILLDTIPIQIWYLSDERTYGAVNQAHADFFGVSKDAMIGRDLGDFLPGAAVHLCRLSNAEVFTDACAITTEEWAPNANGEQRLLAIVKSPKLGADARVEYIVGCAIDITERKRAEQAFEMATVQAQALAEQAASANRAKSEFLANISHELRTPLNGVLGMAQLLQASELTAEQQKFTQIVLDSGEALLGLIDDLLDFSGIETGQLKLERVAFDVIEVLEGVMTALAYRAHDKGLELICAPDPALPGKLWGDPGRLRQVLNNLLDNAIKFTHAGEIQLSVLALEQRADTAILRFSVRDTGVGLDPADSAHLFEKFTQADASSTREYGGLGLGLAMAQQLTKAMDGAIGVESQPGAGAEFWFTARFGQQTQSRCLSALPARLHGYSVLIVDANASHREVLTGRLRHWGLRAAAVVDGQGALAWLHAECAAGNPFHLLLVDERLADPDAGALAQHIQATHALAGVRLVRMPAPRGPEADPPLEPPGFWASLPKPVCYRELWNLLVRLAADAGADIGADTAGSSRRLPRLDTRSRVLVVDDNLSNRQVAVEWLRKLGLSVESVADGKSALTWLAEQMFDLVLLDLQMPGLDGLDVTRRLRGSAPGYAPLNTALIIIAMSAHARPEDRDRCLAAGMNDYLAKPLHIDDLLAVLAKWLAAAPPPAQP